MEQTVCGALRGDVTQKGRESRGRKESKASNPAKKELGVSGNGTVEVSLSPLERLTSPPGKDLVLGGEPVRRGGVKGGGKGALRLILLRIFSETFWLYSSGKETARKGFNKEKGGPQRKPYGHGGGLVWWRKAPESPTHFNRGKLDSQVVKKKDASASSIESQKERRRGHGHVLYLGNAR